MKLATFAGAIAFALHLPAASYARTSAEVACEEATLGRLIHRMAFDFSGSNLFVWSVGGDRYSGLAVVSQFFTDTGLSRWWQRPDSEPLQRSEIEPPRAVEV